MYSVRGVPSGDVAKCLEMYDAKTQTLLYARGIKTEQDAEKFFQKRWNPIQTTQYRDIEKAVERTIATLSRNEHIGIYSDYDCDGISSASALYSTLRSFKHKNIHHYTPQRNVDGFGVNKKGIEMLASNNVSVVFVLDCGTAHPEGIRMMKEKGMDVIVLDHHLPGSELPSPLAMLNPTLEDCMNFSNTETIQPDKLCAAGVTYVFLHLLIAKAQTSSLQHIPVKGWEKWQLDLIALATISDMVPLCGLNRQFVHYGLQVARKSPRPGLQALCKKLRINQKTLTQTDFAFSLIPRINAASRMGCASTAFKLLTSETMEEALQLVNELERLNTKRKTTVATMMKTIQKQVERKDENATVWVFGDRQWKPSLVGLAAQKISEKYNKTIFVWGQSEGEDAVVKGSCRSKTKDVFVIMDEKKELFSEYGGHKRAGGFTLMQSAEVNLEKHLNNATNNATNTPTSSPPSVVVDFICRVKEIPHISKLYTMFSPFGVGNEPITIVLDMCTIKTATRFGKHKEHTKFIFNDESETVNGVSFFSNQKLQEKIDIMQKEGGLVSVYSTVEWDSFTKGLRLRVLDLWRHNN